MTANFLERYGGQTTDELLALEGHYRIDSLVLAFEEALGRKDPDRLSTGERWGPSATAAGPLGVGG